MLMTYYYESMMSFAELWIAAWNRRDIEAVLAHFAEEAQFVSPVARQFVGRPVLQNKNEIDGYWRAALDRISTLHARRQQFQQLHLRSFRLDHATWDERRRELNVVDEAVLDGERKRACEIMQFHESGRQIKGEALYGAVI
jgi:hypothetical protein